jgi:hypothetical protein
MPACAGRLIKSQGACLSVASMVRAIVEILARGALPHPQGTDNGVSECPFFWASAHFSGGTLVHMRPPYAGAIVGVIRTRRPGCLLPRSGENRL